MPRPVGGSEIQQENGVATLSCAGRQADQTSQVGDQSDWEMVVSVLRNWLSEKRKNVTVSIKMPFTSTVLPSTSAPNEVEATKKRRRRSSLKFKC